MIVAVNFPIQAIGKKKPEKKSGLGKFTAMIILHFHLLPQFKNELFHYFTSRQILIEKADCKQSTLNNTRWNLCKMTYPESKKKKKNELKGAERLQKALEQQIDSVHEQMVELQALKIDNYISFL